MIRSDIEMVDRWARENFIYVADGFIDRWRSHADEVRAGRTWTGDCDDLASTVLDLLGDAGADLDCRYRLMVSSARSGTVDHMVGAVQDDQGRFWIVGDTFRSAYRAEGMAHQAVAYNRLSEAGAEPVWRDGAPFRV